MRWLAAVIGILTGTFIFLEPGSAQTPNHNINDGVAFITLNDATGTVKNSGSGFIMGIGGFIMTSNHLFENMDSATDKIFIHLRSKDAPPIPARIFICDLKVTHNFDGCLLYINSTNVRNAGVTNYFNLDCRFPQQGDPVVAAGYPLGDYSPLSIAPGIVSASDPGELFKYYTTAPILPGMSGGPIFAKSGAVTGIAYGQAVAGDKPLSLYFFTPLAFLIDLVPYTQLPCQTATSGETIQKTENQTFPTKVYFQISDPSQQESAHTAIAALTKEGLAAIPEVEIVGKDAPTYGQIRYFINEDRRAAELVSDVMIKSVDKKFEIIQFEGLSAAKKVVEVWYPRTEN